MFRRWLIRGFFVGLLLLLVAGWGVSTGWDMRCGYDYDKNAVDCGVHHGEVEFTWVQGGPFSGGWHGYYGRTPFRVVYSRFFWLHTSITDPDRTVWGFCCMGFAYVHNTAGFRSGPALEFRMISIPFWFLILGTGVALVWVWRKTRPRINRAFPVELAGTRQ